MCSGGMSAVPEYEPGVRIYDVEQRSPEWYAARAGIVTASAIGKLITPRTIKAAANDDSRALTAQLVAERITGYVEPTFTNDDMFRGIEDEPRAVAKYTEHYGVEVQTCGFMVREDLGFPIGFSPDGLVGDDGLVEVKSRRQKKHLQTILANEVPIENYAQLQCGLLVSGRQWVDYLSYCGGMPMWRKRIEPDPRWFEAIVDAVEKFEEAAAEMVAAYDQATEGLAATERVDHNVVELKL